MIGDTLETDIRGAVDLDLTSVLVLTGSTNMEQVAAYPYKPSFIVDSIDKVLDLPFFPLKKFAVGEINENTVLLRG